MLLLYWTNPEWQAYSRHAPLPPAVSQGHYINQQVIVWS